MTILTFQSYLYGIEIKYRLHPLWMRNMNYTLLYIYKVEDRKRWKVVDFIDQRLLLTLFRMGRRQMGEGIYQSFCNFADEKENSLHNFKNLK